MHEIRKFSFVVPFGCVNLRSPTAAATCPARRASFFFLSSCGGEHDPGHHHTCLFTTPYPSSMLIADLSGTSPQPPPCTVGWETTRRPYNLIRMRIPSVFRPPPFHPSVPAPVQLSSRALTCARISSLIRPSTAVRFDDHRYSLLRFLIAYLSVFSSSSTQKHLSHETYTTPKTAFISRTWHSIR